LIELAVGNQIDQLILACTTDALDPENNAVLFARG
jgi:hypothetical protein